MVGITSSNQNDLEGNIAAALLLGSFPGLLVQPYANDTFGRKMCISLFSVVFVIGSVLQTFAWDYWSLVLGRMVSGFGLAVMMISISMYNSEVAPTHIRGQIIGVQQLMVATGIAIAYWTNYFMAESSVQGQGVFRIPLGMQIVPCIMLLVGVQFVPKSPRWLLTKGRTIEALESLMVLRELGPTDPILLDELLQMSDALEDRDESKWIQVLEPANLKRFSVGITILVFQQFAGQNLINYFAPTMFKQMGLTSGNSDLFATGFVGIDKMVMSLPGLYFVDRLGRRPLMLFGTVVMAASFYTIGVYTQFFNDGHVGLMGYIAIGCVYTFMAAYSMSWGVLHYIIPAEIYPQHVRAKSETVGALFEGAFNILSVKLAPVILHSQSGGGTFFIFGALLTVFLVWIFVSFPETKGLALEDVDVVFSTWKRWKPISAQTIEANRQERIQQRKANIA